jgi:hypothetical protein
MIQVRFAEISYSQFDRRHVRSAMGRASRAMAAKMKTVVGGSGSGQIYRRGGRVHTASAPGRPPARYTGNLFRSMKGRASRRGYALLVSAIAPHAALVELGTRRMEPRPAFEPTFAERGLVIEALRAAYGRAIIATPGQVGRPPATVEIN